MQVKGDEGKMTTMTVAFQQIVTDLISFRKNSELEKLDSIER